VVTFDVDIVHRWTPENVDRLFDLLLRNGAYHRLDLANRRLTPGLQGRSIGFSALGSCSPIAASPPQRYTWISLTLIPYRLLSIAAATVALSWLSTAQAADDAKPSSPAQPANDADAEQKRFDQHFQQIRMAANVVTFSGTQLVGTGSVGRYRLGGGALELGVERLPFGRFGFGLLFQVFPPTSGAGGGGDDAPFYVRGEGLVEAGLLAWEGAVPGSVLVGAGVGGDGPRYWFAEDGRFYGLAIARLRLWLSRDTPLQLSYAAIPVAVATGDVSLHEHRFELATGYKLLTLGTKVTYTFLEGGTPERAFFQQEIGAFVGIGLH
jgi:hypothetical protein